MKQLPLTSLSLCLERHHVPQTGLLLLLFFFSTSPNARHTGEWRKPLRPTLACLEIWGTTGGACHRGERAYPLPWPPSPGLVRLEGGERFHTVGRGLPPSKGLCGVVIPGHKAHGQSWGRGCWLRSGASAIRARGRPPLRGAHIWKPSTHSILRGPLRFV